MADSHNPQWLRLGKSHWTLPDFLFDCKFSLKDLNPDLLNKKNRIRHISYYLHKQLKISALRKKVVLQKIKF